MGAEFPVAAAAGGLPAPFWLLIVLKAFGFWLHVAAMHVVYAGLPVAAALALMGGEPSRRLAGRLARAMPVAFALAVNFGIVPLLFMQVLYAPVFYPATILQGWAWFAVIPFLIAAYAGVYLFSTEPRGGWVGVVRVAGSVLAAGLVLAAGFILVNGNTLAVAAPRMLAAYDATQTAGAVTGLWLNVGDPTFVPRWLMMFGLALTTLGVYVILDARLARDADDAWRAYARGTGFLVQTAGLVLFLAMGAWYIFWTLPAEIRTSMFRTPFAHGTAMLSAVLPVVAWVLALRSRRDGRGTDLVVAVQLAALLANVAARQWVQSREIRAFFDPARLAYAPQTGPLVLFLVLFAAGLVLVFWMVRIFMRARVGTEGNR